MRIVPLAFLDAWRILETLCGRMIQKQYIRHPSLQPASFFRTHTFALRITSLNAAIHLYCAAPTSGSRTAPGEPNCRHRGRIYAGPRLWMEEGTPSSVSICGSGHRGTGNSPFARIYGQVCQMRRVYSSDQERVKGECYHSGSYASRASVK